MQLRKYLLKESLRPRYHVAPCLHPLTYPKPLICPPKPFAVLAFKHTTLRLHTAACALHMIAHLCTRLHIIGQKNSGAHQLANLQAISSPLCRLDQHCHPLRLLPLTLRSLEISSSILHQFELSDCSKREFPKSKTWCWKIFPFTFLFRLSSDKRNVVGSNWKCPFENFHFESLKRSRRRGLLMLSDTASLWTRCSSTSGRSAIWTTAHKAHSPPRHRCSFGNV